MKLRQLSIIAAATLLMSACTNKQMKQEDYSEFITKDTANKMIQSYLTSIDSDSVVSRAPQLYSLIMDASELRLYLNGNPEISKVKLMFAHKLEYINAGNNGKPAGLSSDALTIVVAGYDREGNYIFAPGLKVADHCAPCPDNCQLTGTASSNLLQ